MTWQVPKERLAKSIREPELRYHLPSQPSGLGKWSNTFATFPTFPTLPTFPIYPVSLRLRLDWSELDLYGHINNVAYFKYLQASRINYWEQIGIESLHESDGIGPMLAATHCDFRKPLHYPGDISIKASITEMGNTSFHIAHRIFDSEGVLAAEGYDVIVLFNYRKGAKEPIPQTLRTIVEALECRAFPPIQPGK